MLVNSVQAAIATQPRSIELKTSSFVCVCEREREREREREGISASFPNVTRLWPLKRVVVATVISYANVVVVVRRWRRVTLCARKSQFGLYMYIDRQGPTWMAVFARGDVKSFLSFLYCFLSPSLWRTARF